MIEQDNGPALAFEVLMEDRSRACGLVSLCGGAATVAVSAAFPFLAPEAGTIAPVAMALLGVVSLIVGIRSCRRRDPSLKQAPTKPVLLVCAILSAACLIVGARLAAGDDLLARSAVLATLSWFGAVAVSAAAAITFAPAHANDAPRFSRRDLAAFLFLFIVAIALRAAMLDRIPATFSGDEGAGGLVAVAFASGAADNLFTLGWFSFPSLFFAVEGLGVLVGGQTVDAVRGVAAVGGALTVVATAVLGRLAAGPLAGWIAGGILTASHFHLQFSRIALANVWDGFFAAAAAAALLWGCRSGKRAAFVLCGLAVGLGQYFYVSMRMMPVVLLIWCVAAWIASPSAFARRSGGIAGAALVAASVAGPIALAYIAQPDEFLAPFNRVTIFGAWLETEIAETRRSVVEIVLDQAAASAAGFVVRPFAGTFYHPGAPMLLPGAAALFLAGITLAVVRPSLPRLLILLPIAAVLAATSFSVSPPTPQRMVMAAPFVAVFVALPLAAAVDAMRSSALRRFAVVAVSVISLTIAALEARFYFFEANENYVLGGLNTEVATELARYLNGPGATLRQVIFIGHPRMRYASHATVPYLAPSVIGEDIMEPLYAPPAIRLVLPAAFVLLPERRNELMHIRAAFPEGRVRDVASARGALLLTVYEID